MMRLLKICTVSCLYISSTFASKVNLTSNSLVEVSSIENRMLTDLKAVNQTLKDVPTDQERIDTLIHALSRLPTHELDRLNIDLTVKVIAGTAEADNLFRAWNERQTELKTAMKSVLQPAEHMSKLAKVLNDDTSTHAERKQSLIDLESLLDDIDNARDFHTIGAWPALVNTLSATCTTDDGQTVKPDIPMRTLGAWAIGTAVKNSYDYQLWVLESPPTTAVENTATGTSTATTQNDNALIQLLKNLAYSISITDEDGAIDDVIVDFQKRTLYALSSALRGNIDVQTSTQLIHSASTSASGTASSSSSSLADCWLIEQLHALTATTTTSSEVLRKVWSFISDMVEEVQFIRSELEGELTTMLTAAAAAQSKSKSDNSHVKVEGNNTIIDMSGSGNNEEKKMQSSSQATAEFAAQQAVESLTKLSLLGDAFLTEKWLHAAETLLQGYMRELFAIHSSTHTAVTVDSDGIEHTTTVTATDKDHAISVHATVTNLLKVINNALTVFHNASKQTHTSSTLSYTLNQACSLLKEDVNMVVQDAFMLAEMEPESYSDVLEAAGEVSGVLAVMC